MMWYIFAGVLLVALIALVLVNYVRERKYLKKKTSETMSRELWSDIEKEREEALQRQKKFREAMESSKKNNTKC